MKNIAIIGAGSVVFAKNIMADTLWYEAFSDCEIRLMDVNPERLATAGMPARSINQELGTNATIMETADRRKALDGADFVICTVGVGGVEATKDDLLIPAEFGLRQVVGDTLCVGGIFRSVRSIPVLLEICADMKQLCPNALLINYSNPMAMHVLAVARATSIHAVGLCHGVQGTSHTLRMIIAMLEQGVPEHIINAHMDRPFGDLQREKE